MATRIDFVKELEDIFKNHGVYIGAANGELVEDLTIRQIRNMERDYGDNPPKRIRQDLAYIGKCYELGYDMSKARAGDCSGIIVYALTKIGLIKYDMRARDLQAKSTKISLNSLKPGDLVFDKQTAATHVGTYVGDGMVIESRGRDYGVVKRALKEGPWVTGGKFTWWEDDPQVFTFTRVLKYTKGAIMKGEDVTVLQTALSKKGYAIGVIDGEYGPATKNAVTEYQKKANLTADGIAGKDTVTSLGYKFQKE